MLRPLTQPIKPEPVLSTGLITVETPRVLNDKEAGPVSQRRPVLSVAGTCHSMEGSFVPQHQTFMRPATNARLPPGKDFGAECIERLLTGVECKIANDRLGGAFRTGGFAPPNRPLSIALPLLKSRQYSLLRKRSSCRNFETFTLSGNLVEKDRNHCNAKQYWLDELSQPKSDSVFGRNKDGW